VDTTRSGTPLARLIEEYFADQEARHISPKAAQL